MNHYKVVMSSKSPRFLGRVVANPDQSESPFLMIYRRKDLEQWVVGGDSHSLEEAISSIAVLLILQERKLVSVSVWKKLIEKSSKRLMKS
jgi:hypothetical protein